MAKRINQKLAARFVGPFQIVGKCGPVAYKLQLPPTSWIHPVFHVSQLKKAVGNYSVEPMLPEGLEVGLTDVTEPDDILAFREVTKNGETIMQWLVKWKARPVDEATWDDEFIIRSQFPSFSLEDKAALIGGGTVRDPLASGQVNGPRTWKVYTRRNKGNNGKTNSELEGTRG